MVALTNHGLTCQAWGVQSPHEHLKTNDAYFPTDGGVVGASNYCRNFEGSGRPWCFTVHLYIVWEFCDLQICDGEYISPSTYTSSGNSVTFRSVTGERGGSVVECRTPEREVGGSKPTAAVLCP